MKLDYFAILILILIAFFLGMIILFLSYLLVKQTPYIDKVSAYECGFDAFDDARLKFDVRFYLIAILFIIFDLEISFLFPWALTLGTIGLFGYWIMFIFLFILTIGFIYEWKKGALQWN